MAKRKEPIDERVAVWCGSGFYHDGKPVRVRDIVWMSKAEAADLVAMRCVRYATPDEAAGSHE